MDVVAAMALLFIKRKDNPKIALKKHLKKRRYTCVTFLKIK